MSLPVKRYATALYRAAEEKGALDAVAGDLESLHAALSDDQVRAVITNPAAPAGVLRSALEKATEGAHELVQNVVRVCLERRRAPVLTEIFPAFQEMARESRGEALGVAESAKSLDDDAVRQLTELASSLSGKKVTLEVAVKPELIGGVRLRVGNTLYDGSVALALEQLHKQLMAAPLPTDHGS